MISLLSPLISLQNRQKYRFEPTLKRCSRNKASRAKKPYFMRLSEQTKRPENNTKLPDLDKMTKRLEIVLSVMSRHVGSNPTISAKEIDKFRLVDFFIHCESNGISSRFSVHLITEGAYHQPQAVSSFAMMIYNGKPLVIYNASH